MKPAEGLHKVQNLLTKKTDEILSKASQRPRILVATIDSEIRNGLTELFRPFSLNTIWLKGVEAAKSVLAREKITACLCGFWLQDGTYRELIRHIRRERLDIPVVIVSTPACPDEYRDFLAAVKLGAVDFLSYPYRTSDLDRMPWLTLGSDTRVSHLATDVIGSGLYAGEAA